MKTKLTWLVLGAVGLVGVLAVADAVRSPGEPAKPAASGTTTARPRAPTLRETLRREAVSGLVLYSDPYCIVHTLVLPSLHDEIVRREDGTSLLRRCRVNIASGRILGGMVETRADGRRAARCRHGRVQILDAVGNWTRWPFRGCPIALLPDGRLAQVRDGAVRHADRVLLRRQDLMAAARLHPNVAGIGAETPLRVRVTDLAWLDERRLVVGLEIRVRLLGRQYVAAVFDGRAVTGLAASLDGPYDGFVVSGSGGFAAAADGTLFIRDGGARDPRSGVPQGRALGFSPDDRWLAYATGVSVYLIPTPANRVPGTIIRLPVPARDMVWEAVNQGTAGARSRSG